MCGIVGLVARSTGVDLAQVVAAMSEAVAHRGPDHRGEWLDTQLGIGLGHRRLAILDLTPTGNQPMASLDGRWVLVLNGEIYDHQEHRAALLASGATLRGTSDTEVLVELVARRGLAAALTAVDGMFALGAFDREERTLHLARDRMGERPLYYAETPDCFAFASETTALRTVPGADTGVDPVAVAEYLRYGFVPAPHAIHRQVRKLPAGSILSVPLAGGGASVASYWSLTELAQRGVTHRTSVPDEALVDEAEGLLKQSLTHRIEADVPVGTFLSGGLDSSVITAIAQSVSARPVRTFTVAVGGADDESTAAASMARHLGTDHTTLPLPELDALSLAQGVVETYDEPFADPSAIPMTLLCEAARHHVTVALSGDAGDELLAGYNRYRIAHGGVAKLLRVPRAARGVLSRGLAVPSQGAWDRVGAVVPGMPPALGTKAHKLAAVLASADVLEAYGALAGQWRPDDVMVSAPDDPGTPMPRVPGASALDQMLLADQLRTLPDNMFVKVDRASMAVALEVRVPFLSRDFVEFSWHLPEAAKVRDGQGKWLVRQLLARHVPRELWDRPKMGFDPPLAEWLRGPLKEWAQDLLAPDALRRQGLLRPEPVQQALAAHLGGRRNNDYLLWTVLMLQAWLERNRG